MIELLGGGKERASGQRDLRFGGAGHLIASLSVNADGSYAYSMPYAAASPQHVVQAFRLPRVLLHSNYGDRFVSANFFYQ